MKVKVVQAWPRFLSFDLGFIPHAASMQFWNGMIRWFSQVFAGYVLHVGPMPVSLKVGEEVFCEASWLRAKGRVELTWTISVIHPATSNNVIDIFLQESLLQPYAFQKTWIFRMTHLRWTMSTAAKWHPTIPWPMCWTGRWERRFPRISVMSGGPRFAAFQPHKCSRSFSHQG